MLGLKKGNVTQSSSKKNVPKTRNARKISSKPAVESIEPVAVNIHVSQNIPKKRNAGIFSTKPEVSDDESISPVAVLQNSTKRNVPTRKNVPKTRNAGKVSTEPSVLDAETVPPVAVDTNVSQNSTKRNVARKRNAGKISTKPPVLDDQSVPPVDTLKKNDKCKQSTKISDFFKAASKPVGIGNYEMKNSKAGDSRQYYLDALKKTLRSKDCSLSEICVVQIQ